MISQYTKDIDTWTEGNIESATRGRWFRHGQLPQKTGVINRLHPVRYKVPYCEESDTYTLPLTVDIPCILDHVLATYACNYRSQNITNHLAELIDLPGMFSWWSDGKPSLFELAQREIDILTHHLSSTAFNDRFVEIHHLMYGLFQQLFEADPVMFIMQNCIRNRDSKNVTYEPQLVAIPQPVLFARRALRSNFLTTGVFSAGRSTLRGYLPISYESKECCATYVTNIASPESHLEFMQLYNAACPSKDEVDIVNMKAGTQLQRKYVQRVTDTSTKFTHKAAPCLIGDVRLWQSHIPVATHYSTQHTTRKGYYSMFVGEEDPFFDTNIETIAKLREEMADIYIKGGEPQADATCHKDVPILQCLNVPTSLSEAILGQRMWDAHAITQARILLGSDKNARDKYISSWRNMASELVRAQFAELQKTEQRLYKNKSFKNSKHDPEESDHDNETIIVHEDDTVSSSDLSDGDIESGHEEEDDEEDDGIVAEDNRGNDEVGDNENSGHDPPGQVGYVEDNLYGNTELGMEPFAYYTRESELVLMEEMDTLIGEM